ncbi:hypothetical protein H6H03_20855 [Nostoc paludosum FACHB-159]|uniref:Uncharacterized protein n=1 Tax=Nostoc paludosum FACHB-159 TaxID=2692908 RepID=A0ABR8KC79_9NOSO|nr:hypothetical protein [Nostoc paludosum FACHB-159]
MQPAVNLASENPTPKPSSDTSIEAGVIPLRMRQLPAFGTSPKGDTVSFFNR